MSRYFLILLASTATSKELELRTCAWNVGSYNWAGVTLSQLMFKLRVKREWDSNCGEKEM